MNYVPFVSLKHCLSKGSSREPYRKGAEKIGNCENPTLLAQRNNNSYYNPGSQHFSTFFYKIINSNFVTRVDVLFILLLDYFSCITILFLQIVMTNIKT